MHLTSLPISGDAEHSLSGITWPSVFAGTLGVFLICGLTPFNEYIVNNTPMVGSHFPVVVTFFFFILITCINASLHCMAPRAAMTSRELAVVMLMMLVACCIPTQGMIRSLLPTQISSFHLGRADPHFWNSFLGLKLPAWLFPVHSIADGRTDPIVTDFYNRLPEGGSVPYLAWIRSTAVWSIFVGGLVLTLISFAWIVREQWAVNERLPFPLAQLELALIDAPRPGDALNTLFRSPLFWTALLFVFCYASLSALSAYLPKYFPDIPRGYNFLDIMTREPFVHLNDAIRRNSIYFTFIGLTYFIQTRTAFSLWAIWFLMQMVNWNLRINGVETRSDHYRNQHLGATIVFAAGIFWIGRRHWERVIRHALFGRSVDEVRQRAASFRIPLFLMLTGLGIMTGWLLIVGVQWWVAGTIILTSCLAHIVTTRVVAETGLPIFRSTVMVNHVVSGFSPVHFAARDIFFMGTSHMTIGSYTSAQSSMNFSLHGLHVADASGLMQSHRQRLGIVMVLVWTLVFGFATCAVSSLHCYYSYAMTLGPTSTIENEHLLEDLPKLQLVDSMNALSENRWISHYRHDRTHLLIGMSAAAVLQLCAWRFPWWPLLPVGYVVGTGLYMELVRFSVMLGWLAKVLIVRFGGAKMFIQAQPVFVGMIVGETMAGGAWLIVNLIVTSLGYASVPIKFLP